MLLTANQQTSDLIRDFLPLIPHDVPTQAEVLPVLKRVLQLCRQDWVFNFLFLTDTSHLTFFTSPLLRRDALTSHMVMDHFEPPSVRQYPYALKLEASTVYVPAFMVEDFSLGFGIEERAATFSIPDRGVTRRKEARPDQFRYIWDNESGHFILAFQGEDSIIIECVTHLSATARRRVWTKYDKSILDVLGNPLGSFDPQEVLSKLVSCICIREYRPCPQCGCRPDGPSCLCTPLVALPRSFSGMPHKQVLQSHSGAFEGVLHEAMFHQGMPVQQRLLASTVIIEGTANPELTFRLTDWAVKQHLRSIRFLPQPPLQSWQFVHEPYLEETVAITRTAGGIMRLATAEYTSSQGFMLECEKRQVADRYEIEGTVGTSTAGTVVDQSAAEQNANMTSGSDATSVLSELQEIANEQASKQAQVAYGQSFVPTVPAEILVASHILQDYVGAEEVGETSHKESITERTETPTGSGSDPAPPKPKKAHRNARIELNLYEHDSEEDRRIEAMEEARMRRNRESARRSNLKRKAEMDARKKELDSLKAREKDLRVQEGRLRSENRWLRSIWDNIEKGDRQEE